MAKVQLNRWADRMLDHLSEEANSVDLCTRDALDLLDARFDEWFDGTLEQDEEVSK